MSAFMYSPDSEEVIFRSSNVTPEQAAEVLVAYATYVDNTSSKDDWNVPYVYAVSIRTTAAKIIESR